MKLKVKVIGVINDEKFIADGNGNIDADGIANLELRYNHCPSNWCVMNYSDPLVLLAGYREAEGATNFSQGFSAASTIDFGGGMILRKTAKITTSAAGADAVYSISGVAHTGEISRILDYSEYLHPMENGDLMGIGNARWETKDGILDAMVSTRFKFSAEAKSALTLAPMKRGFSVDASTDGDGHVFKGKFDTLITGV